MDDTNLYKVTPWYEGGELFDLAPLPEDSAKLVFAQLLDALEFIHSRGTFFKLRGSRSLFMLVVVYVSVVFRLRAGGSANICSSLCLLIAPRACVHSFVVIVSCCGVALRAPRGQAGVRFVRTDFYGSGVTTSLNYFSRAVVLTCHASIGRSFVLRELLHFTIVLWSIFRSADFV